VGHVAEISSLSGDCLHWKVNAPRDRNLSWETCYVETTPGQYLRWETAGNPVLPNEGTVSFHPEPSDRETEVTPTVDFDPPGGALGKKQWRTSKSYRRRLSTWRYAASKASPRRGRFRHSRGTHQPAGAVIGCEGDPSMRALCWYGKEDVRVDGVPRPEIINPRDAIVEITATAICGSDPPLQRRRPDDA